MIEHRGLPRIYFACGWWRVWRHPGPWSHLSFVYRAFVTKAHEHVNKLNKSPEARMMRDAFYALPMDTRRQMRKAARVGGDSFERALQVAEVAEALSPLKGEGRGGPHTT